MNNVITMLTKLTKEAFKQAWEAAKQSPDRSLEEAWEECTINNGISGPPVVHEQSYSGHTFCNKCLTWHWMYGLCRQPVKVCIEPLPPIVAIDALTCCDLKTPHKA